MKKAAGYQENVLSGGAALLGAPLGKRHAEEMKVRRRDIAQRQRQITKHRVKHVIWLAGVNLKLAQTIKL